MVQSNTKIVHVEANQDVVKIKNEFGYEEDVQVLRGDQKLKFFKDLKEKWTESFVLRE